MTPARKPASRRSALPDKTAFSFAYVYGGLAVVLALAAFGAGVEGPWKVIPKPVTVTHVVAPATGAKLAAAWGKPDSTVPGGQINAGLKGLTCDVYQARKAIVCFA